MQVITDIEVDRDKWRQLYTSSIFTTPFQSAEFYDIFNSIEGYSAKVFATEQDDCLTSLLVYTIQAEKGIKSYFSRRGIIYGGPLIKEGAENDFDALIKIVTKISKKLTIYSEVRNLNDYSIFKETFYRNGWEYLPYTNFIIECSNEDLLFRKLGQNRKRQIIKAKNNGIEVKEPENLSEVQEFYEILTSLYKTKVKKPLLPWDFFKEAYSRKFGKFFLIKFNSAVIGGIYCPILKDKCIYEFYVGGMDSTFKEHYPSISATWQSMIYASKNNIPCMDLMGAGKLDEDYGVREFKSRFGGQLVEYGRFNKVNNKFLYNLGKAYLSLMKKIN
jgi:lipid II:glycine glycyltransferase (peptidoglycan interpeptide bridge formation enzyme)